MEELMQVFLRQENIKLHGGMTFFGLKLMKTSSKRHK